MALPGAGLLAGGGLGLGLATAGDGEAGAGEGAVLPVQEPKRLWQLVPQWPEVTPHQLYWLQHWPLGQQSPLLAQAPPAVV